MLLLRRASSLFRTPRAGFAKKRDTEKDPGTAKQESRELFYMPVMRPVFLGTGLLSIMNQHLQRYLNSTGIRNIVAIPIKDPGLLESVRLDSYSAFLERFQLKDDSSYPGS